MGRADLADPWDRNIPHTLLSFRIQAGMQAMGHAWATFPGRGDQAARGIVLATRQPVHFIHCTPVILISSSVEFSVESNGQAGLRKMWKDYRPASSFSLLLLFFSILFSRFSSRRLASSASWCRRHLWKFSTTTPTNILSTKKATINRKEMKYSSIQGLWFIIGWNTDW